MQNTFLKHYRHLQPQERMTLASLVHQKYSAGEIAKVLKRNTRGSGYCGQAAIRYSQQRCIDGRAPKKLHEDGALFGVVRHFLSIRCSPEQIALTLTHTCPKGHELRVVHKTIYKCIYAQPPSAVNVLQGFTDKLLSIAQPVRQSMTHDQDRKMALHRQLSQDTGIAVYFCDPHSPCQWSSNENINGLVRQYLPKDTDLSVYSQEQPDASADEINKRLARAWGYDHPCPSTGIC